MIKIWRLCRFANRGCTSKLSRLSVNRGVRFAMSVLRNRVMLNVLLFCDYNEQMMTKIRLFGSFLTFRFGVSDWRYIKRIMKYLCVFLCIFLKIVLDSKTIVFTTSLLMDCNCYIIDFVFVFQFAFVLSESHCIWYDGCYIDNGKIKNCYYDGPAKPLDIEGQVSWFIHKNNFISYSSERFYFIQNSDLIHQSEKIQSI